MKHRSNMCMKYFKYGSGYSYFITICTYKRYRAFGKISDGFFVPLVPEIEDMFRAAIEHLEKMFDGVTVDNWVIMPDHIHLLITILSENESECNLSEVVSSFKRTIVFGYMDLVHKGVVSKFNRSLFQKNFYDHIVRNEEDYNNVYDYIENNPVVWWNKYGDD